MFKSDPEKSTSSASQASSLSVEEIIEKIPFLRTLERNPKSEALLNLMREVANAPYSSANKYELMYKIIRISNLISNLFPRLVEENSVALLSGCKDMTPASSMAEKQQAALFYLYRNITADYFHILNETQTKEMLINFQNLCRGIPNTSFLLQLHTNCNRLSRGKGAEKIYKATETKINRITKLLSQM